MGPTSTAVNIYHSKYKENKRGGGRNLFRCNMDVMCLDGITAYTLYEQNVHSALKYSLLVLVIVGEYLGMPRQLGLFKLFLLRSD